MTNCPLLSIIAVNKNDFFQANQLQRTKFILNYFIYSLKKMDAMNKVEYLIVDWGSDEPLSNYFYKEISLCPAIKFINVPKEETEKYKLSLDVSKALNVGIKNSLGEHVMLTGSDIIFPLSVFNNLLNLLENPKSFGLTGDEYKLVPRKFLEDDFFIYEESMEKVDLYLQSLNQSALPYPRTPLNSGGGTGGNLLKKKQWLQIGGVKKTKKHNRGQDIVNFHETSKICSHIDTSTFGSFSLKLPRTKIGMRQAEVEKEKNILDNLTFENNEDVINSINFEIINNLNPPKKKISFNIQSLFENKESITVKEIIKTIFDCILFTNFSGISLKSQDIKFILKMKKTIKTSKLKNIILDEKQASRFMVYLARSLPDVKFIVFMDSRKNTPLEILKFRTALTERVNQKNPRHYGSIKVVNYKQSTLESINKLQDVCIIQDHSSDNQFYFKKEFSSTKINAIRSLISNTKNIMYSIEGDFVTNQKYPKILLSNTFINFVIYALITLHKVKKVLGNLKGQL